MAAGTAVHFLLSASCTPQLENLSLKMPAGHSSSAFSRAHEQPAKAGAALRGSPKLLYGRFSKGWSGNITHTMLQLCSLSDNEKGKAQQPRGTLTGCPH